MAPSDKLQATETDAGIADGISPIATRTAGAAPPAPAHPTMQGSVSSRMDRSASAGSLHLATPSEGCKDPESGSCALSCPAVLLLSSTKLSAAVVHSLARMPGYAVHITTSKCFPSCFPFSCRRRCSCSQSACLTKSSGRSASCCCKLVACLVQAKIGAYWKRMAPLVLSSTAWRAYDSRREMCEMVLSPGASLSSGRVTTSGSSWTL